MVAQAGKKNAWRLRTESAQPWRDRLRAGNPDKYFMVSADSHINEPIDFFEGRIPEEYRSRLPHVRTDADGTQWLITEGWTPQLVRVPKGREDLLPSKEEFENYDVIAAYTDKMEDEDVLRQVAGRTVEGRRKDWKIEGVDAEIAFPNKGALSFATPDTKFAAIMCHAWNDWAREFYKDVFEITLPMALIPAGDVELAIKEVQWAAANNFHGLLLPNRPVYSRLDQPRFPLEYNDKVFEPLWSAIAETGLPITFHVSTGEDPRAVRGNGGAIINYVSHAITTTLEPLVQMIASGVFERHRSLRAGASESGIGWVPWLLHQMDHGYRAHHMWVRPVIPRLPSEYFREHCFSSFIEEREALEQCIALGLEDNLLWSNDYPHHEGTYPHSALAIERQMGSLTETQRAKVLGENARNIFKIKPAAANA